MQIYDFEKNSPPILNERMIEREIEKKRLQRQTALVALAGILIGVVMVMLGFMLFKDYKWLSIICFAYVIISAAGSGVMAVVFNRKGGLLI